MSNKHQIAIIKYNAGNIRSVLFALERLGVQASVTDDEREIRAASHVIFPGVGSAATAMPYLRSRGLDKLLASLTQPFLGICLGMQLMCRYSEEGDTECLSIIDAAVKKFPATDSTGLALKIPHMGWNSLHQTSGKLCNGLSSQPYAYFVHSYYAEQCSNTAAITHYGLPFSSMLQKDNFFGVQFHTEKSAGDGEIILKNFLSL